MGVTRRSLLAAPFLWLPARSATRRSNVVAVMTDDHGAWAMGAYGCRDMHTPNLDQLAAEGARFTRAYACSPIDSPSRMSYLTGLIPSQHGVQDDLLDEDSYGAKSRRFLDGHLTYSEILAKNGYTNIAVRFDLLNDRAPLVGTLVKRDELVVRAHADARQDQADDHQDQNESDQDQQQLLHDCGSSCAGFP